MDSRELVRATFESGVPARPPYVPIVGEVAEVLAQIEGPAYGSNPQRQAVALIEAASALHADAITVGVGAELDGTLDVIRRMKPMLAGRALVAVLQHADAQHLRSLAEADVDVIMLLLRGEVVAGKLKTLANAAGFYRTPTVLVAPDLQDPLGAASVAGLAGVVPSEITGDEDLVVGGGLSEEVLRSGRPPDPPRTERFFWTFPDQVPPDASPEDLAELGRSLTSQ